VRGNKGTPDWSNGNWLPAAESEIAVKSFMPALSAFDD
jgi:hypothetical protein